MIVLTVWRTNIISRPDQQVQGSIPLPRSKQLQHLGSSQAVRNRCCPSPGDPRLIVLVHSRIDQQLRHVCVKHLPHHRLCRGRVLCPVLLLAGKMERHAQTNKELAQSNSHSKHVQTGHNAPAIGPLPPTSADPAHPQAQLNRQNWPTCSGPATYRTTARNDLKHSRHVNGSTQYTSLRLPTCRSNNTAHK
jgi:hypothetical protein